MTDPGFRRGLRMFIVQETMLRNFKGAKAGQFDKDHDDWSLLGDAAFNLRKEWNEAYEQRTFDDWWCRQEGEYLERWPERRQAIEDLYKLLDKVYFDPHPQPLQPCGAVKK